MTQGPDDSGRHDLSKTVEQLSPESTLPDREGAIVALTKEKAVQLIGGIHKLAKASLANYGEQKWIKRLLAAGVVVGLVLFAGIAYLAYKQKDLQVKLDEVIAKQQAYEEARKRDSEKLDEIPRVKIKPADAADPTAEPVAVLEVPPPKAVTSAGPKPSGKTLPPKPAAIEIPLGKPMKKKETEK